MAFYPVFLSVVFVVRNQVAQLTGILRAASAAPRAIGVRDAGPDARDLLTETSEREGEPALEVFLDGGRESESSCEQLELHGEPT